MRKLIVIAVFGLAGLAAFAGTCTITHISLVQTDGTHKTFGGQLDNNSGINILQHNFLVTFLDSGLQVVETRTVDGCLRSLQDGKSDFFSATSSLAASQTNVALARISFDSAFNVGTVAAGDVTITITSVTRTGMSLVVSGTIKNNDVDTLVDAAACAVIRDSGGAVVIVAKQHVGDIATDATTNFTVTATVPADATAHAVDVWVDGLDGSADAAPIAPASDLDNAVACPAPSTATNTPASTGTPSPTLTPTDTPTETATNTPTRTSTPVTTSTPC